MNILNLSIRRENILLSGVILLFLFVYLVPISLIFRNAFSNHFSHGLLIVAISVYMVWTRRDRLRQAQITPSLVMGSMSLAFGSILLIAGAFSGTPLLEGFSLVIGVFGGVWLIFGSSVIRIVAIPVSFLIFMFPIFDKLFRGYTDHLQLAAASIGATLLQMAGMPIFHLRDVIQLPHITMVVGEACSGVNHMIALMTLGAFLGYVTETRWFVKLMFVIMGLVLGILANGIRVALIGIWTKFYGGESFHGPFDIFYSSFVFFVGLVAIVVIGFILLKHNKEKMPVSGKPIETHLKVASDWKYFRLSLITAAIILMLTWTYQTLAKPLPFHLKRNLDEFSLEVKNWEVEKAGAIREPYENGNFDVKARRIYHDRSGNQMMLFIGYLASQTQGNNIDHYPHAINQNGTSVVQVRANPSGTFRIRNTIYQGRDGLRQIYFWYDINGRIVADRNRAKLATIMDAFSRRRTNGAVVVVSTDVKGRGQEKEREKTTIEFIKTILPLVHNSLNNVNE